MKTNTKRYDCLISALACSKAIPSRRARDWWLGWVIIQLIQTLYRHLSRDDRATLPTPTFSQNNTDYHRLIWTAGSIIIAVMMILMIVLKFYFYSSWK